MSGAVDVLMGTFSKSPGAVGGYVVGDGALDRLTCVDVARALFTHRCRRRLSSRYAGACRNAGRARAPRPLWANTRYMGGLVDVGLRVPHSVRRYSQCKSGTKRSRSPWVALSAGRCRIRYAQYPAVPWPKHPADHGQRAPDRRVSRRVPGRCWVGSGQSSAILAHRALFMRCGLPAIVLDVRIRRCRLPGRCRALAIHSIAGCCRRSSHCSPRTDSVRHSHTSFRADTDVAPRRPAPAGAGDDRQAHRAHRQSRSAARARR